MYVDGCGGEVCTKTLRIAFCFHQIFVGEKSDFFSKKKVKEEKKIPGDLFHNCKGCDGGGARTISNFMYISCLSHSHSNVHSSSNRKP